MGTGRKIGKLMLGISRGARKMSEGFDMILGEQRTRAGEGFSKDRAGKRAELFTQSAKQKNQTSGMMSKGKDMDFLDDSKKSSGDISIGSKSKKDKKDRKFY